jgi:hypothetical protein
MGVAKSQSLRLNRIRARHAAMRRLLDRIGREGKRPELVYAMNEHAEKLAEQLGRLLVPEGGDADW